MSKSGLYGANSTTQTVADGGSIGFGNIIRRFGCNCNMISGNAILEGCGYYSIDSNFSVEPSGAGTMVISLANNGVAIPGASASVTAASGDSYQVSIPCVVLLSCGEIGSISAILSGVSASVTNSSIDVEKM